MVCTDEGRRRVVIQKRLRLGVNNNTRRFEFLLTQLHVDVVTKIHMRRNRRSQPMENETEINYYHKYGCG